LTIPLAESPASDASSSPEWVLVARLVRPQGRHGEVLADLLTDFPERFAQRRRLYLLSPELPAKPVELENHWLHQGRVVLKFTGIDSIEDAEALRGHEVAIPGNERAPLEDGAVYISDLIGCLLIDSGTGSEVGVIADVDREASAAPLLVIAGAAEILIPFARAFQPRIDLAAKRIEMRLPEGLVDLNAPARKDVAGKPRP
jgi:16S rRNA processing protein RimM